VYDVDIDVVIIFFYINMKSCCFGP